MTSNELKELVKAHFSLVEADATEEIVNEEITEEFTEEVTEEVAEVFGEIADENSAFVLKFPGDELEVGDKVIVVTTDGQEMDAPNGEHKLMGGVTIVTKDSIVESISKEVEASAEDFAEKKEEEMMEVEDVVEDIVEEVIEEVKDEMMEETVDAKEIVEEIVSAIQEEMGKMKEKMMELEEKVVKVMDVPAAVSTMKSGPQGAYGNQGFSSQKPRYQEFKVESAANADRIKLAINQLKNK